LFLGFSAFLEKFCTGVLPRIFLEQNAVPAALILNRINNCQLRPALNADMCYFWTGSGIYMNLRCKRSRLLTLVAIFSASLCACRAASFSTNPIADAFVATGPTENLSGDNFGAAGALAVAAPGLAQGEFQTVMKFDLSGALGSFNAQFGAGQWTVQSVTLQLTSSSHSNAIFNNIAAGNFNVSLMQNNSWVEGTGTGGIPTTDGISFNSLQSAYINNATDQALGTFSFPGGSTGVNGYSLDLSSDVISDLVGGDDLSLRLFAADTSVSYLFSSRNAGGTVEPDLVITADAVPEPGTLALGVSGLAMVAIRLRRRRS
jgi:hypothetical protein